MTLQQVVSPRIIEMLLGAEGEDFCRLLRRIYYEELRQGRIDPDVSESERPLLQRASDLGLLHRAEDGQLRFTSLGYEIGNVAKEYTNWLDAGRGLPEGITDDMVRHRRILDVGCGFGRHLLGFASRGGQAYGVDLQESYLRLSQAFAAQLGATSSRVARARAEHLPFRDGAFDLVFCRLVLNYVEDIDHTLGELTRVLSPQGILVFLIESPALRVRQLLRSRWRHNWRTVGFTVFGLLNAFLLQLGGRQVVLRAQGRMHARHSPAWPRLSWWNRRLSAHGFLPVSGTLYQHPEHPELFIGRRS